MNEIREWGQAPPTPALQKVIMQRLRYLGSIVARSKTGGYCGSSKQAIELGYVQLLLTLDGIQLQQEVVRL